MAGPDVIRCSHDGDLTVTAWWDSDTASPVYNVTAYGAALPVIAARLTDLTATMRGEDALDVAWTLPHSLADGAQLLGRTGSYTLYAAAVLQQSTEPEM